MKEEYPIHLADEVIGAASICREGLYYCIRCSCRLSAELPYQIWVTCGERRENLGVCVPEGKCFGLKTRLPIKRLGEGKPVFCAVAKYQQTTGVFLPVCAEKPFVHISRLREARMDRKDGVSGLLLPE